MAGNLRFTVPPNKLSQQLKRGWTNNDIQDVLDYPALTLPTTDYSSGDSATVYYRSDGYYVIRNDVTGGIIQISDRTDPDWYDEHRNQVVSPII